MYMDMRKGLAPPRSFSFFNARPSVKSCLKSKNNLLRKPRLLSKWLFIAVSYIVRNLPIDKSIINKRVLDLEI